MRVLRQPVGNGARRTNAPRDPRFGRREPGDRPSAAGRIRLPYIESFTAALEPVFLAASGFAVMAFLLTWLLREVPLPGRDCGELRLTARGPLRPRAGADHQRDRDRPHAHRHLS